MSAAVQELNLIIDGMDDSLVRVLINVARNFSHPKEYKTPSQKRPLKIGLLKGKKLYSDNYDIIHGDDDYVAGIFYVYN